MTLRLDPNASRESTQLAYEQLTEPRVDVAGFSQYAPYGVQEAESRARLLAIQPENLDVFISITDPTATLVLISRAAQVLERDGVACDIAWLRDARGVIEGVCIRGERRVA
jgi:hypothetical protein